MDIQKRILECVSDIKEHVIKQQSIISQQAEELAKQTKLKHEAYNNLTRCHEQMSELAEANKLLEAERNVARADVIGLSKRNVALRESATQAEKERDIAVKALERIDSIRETFPLGATEKHLIIGFDRAEILAGNAIKEINNPSQRR